MNTEYASLRSEINQYKSGQITLFTATASATGIMLGLFVNLMINQKSDLFFSAILIFLPLMVILPSSWMYFEKAIKINRLEAYCTAYAKNILYTPLKDYHYLGYSEYKKEYLKTFATRESIYIKNAPSYIDKYQRFVKAEKALTHWIFRDDLRYWTNSFWAYLGLETICVLVFVVFVLQNPSIIFQMTHMNSCIYLSVALSIIFTLLIIFLKIYGDIFSDNDQYFMRLISLEVILIFFWSLQDILLLGHIGLVNYTVSIVSFAIFCLCHYNVATMNYFRTLTSSELVSNHFPFVKFVSSKLSLKVMSFVSFIVSTIIIYGFGVVYTCINESLVPNICGVAIISISIIILSIIWKIVTVSSILMGNSSYQKSLDRWEYVIEKLMKSEKQDPDFSDDKIEIYPSVDMPDNKK
ncbi:hypothetical protein [Methanomicrobium mobile]|uniref:hypothetical protein n=1 Tax=Methanomicrobium mobile TaxID=2205 RepID=UPI0005B2719F|nr:hypothetical protein [Methanomicrobium mobile]